MAKVFLSYARADAQRVQRIAEALQDAGHDVWWDRQISGGSDFGDVIEDALADAEVVVVAWSQSACKSAWVRDEAGAGRDRSRLVPISLDRSPPPMGFRQYQTIDFSASKAASFQASISALDDSILEKAGCGTAGAGYRARVHSQHAGPRAWGLSSPRLGILAAVVLLTALAAAAWWFAMANRASDGRPMLAVLPFENIGGDPQSAYFGEGLAEDISYRLSRVEDLRVISRSSAAQFEASGKPLSRIHDDLGASAVLDGSVRRVGNRVRVVVQLIDVEDDEQLWSESYDHQLADLFDIQSSIASKVADALQARLTSIERSRIGRAPTSNVAAYEEYLRGRHQFAQRNGDALKSAAEHFQRAIKLQPDFAAAHSGLSDTYAHLDDYGVLESEVAFPLAIAAAKRAVSLDSSSAEARASLGHVYSHQRRWAEAEQQLRNAVQLDPSNATAQHWLGHLLRTLGHTREALERHRIAQRLDPLGRTTNMNLAISLAATEDYEGAIRQYQRTLELYPDHGPTHEFLSWALVRAGRLKEALAVRKKAYEIYVEGGSDPTRERAGLAEILAGAGRHDDARRILAEAESNAAKVEMDSAYMARGYAALGDIDGSLRWIRTALSGELSDLDQHHVADPVFAAVRKDPRYQRILSETGWR